MIHFDRQSSTTLTFKILVRVFYIVTSYTIKKGFNMSNALMNKFTNISYPLVQIDGTDFPKYEAYRCNSYSYYHTEATLANAISSCRDDINCSMVSILECSNETSEFQLCSQSPEMIHDLKSCTYRKKGTVTYIMNYF